MTLTIELYDLISKCYHKIEFYDDTSTKIMNDLIYEKLPFFHLLVHQITISCINQHEHRQIIWLWHAYWTSPGFTISIYRMKIHGTIARLTYFSFANVFRCIVHTVMWYAANIYDGSLPLLLLFNAWLKAIGNFGTS